MHAFRVSPELLVTAALLLSFVACGPRKPAPNIEAEAAVATTAWLDKKFGLVNDYETNAFLNTMTERLKRAFVGLELDVDNIEEYKNYPWQVFMLNSDQPNALSAGAGSIFITKGLVKRVNSEAELAAIVSHEMAHEILGHTKEAIYSRGLSSSPTFVFTLDHELSADTLSILILKVAGYDPTQALSAITNDYRQSDRKVAPAPGGQKNTEWLEPRLANLQAQIASLGGSLTGTVNSREFNSVRAKF